MIIIISVIIVIIIIMGCFSGVGAFLCFMWARLRAFCGGSLGTHGAFEGLWGVLWSVWGALGGLESVFQGPGGRLGRSRVRLRAPLAAAFIGGSVVVQH